MEDLGGETIVHVRAPELNHDWIKSPTYALVIFIETPMMAKEGVFLFRCMKSFGGYEKSWK